MDPNHNGTELEYSILLNAYKGNDISNVPMFLLERTLLRMRRIYLTELSGTVVVALLTGLVGGILTWMLSEVHTIEPWGMMAGVCGVLAVRIVGHVRMGYVMLRGKPIVQQQLMVNTLKGQDTWDSAGVGRARFY